MGTPSRVKGGLQEMRTVVELTGVTVRLLTDSNRSADKFMVITIFKNMPVRGTYIVPGVVLVHFG